MTNLERNVMRRRTIIACAFINLAIFAALAKGIFEGWPNSLLLFGVLTATILGSIIAISANGLQGKITPVHMEGISRSQAPVISTIMIAIAFGFCILAMLLAMFWI